MLFGGRLDLAQRYVDLLVTTGIDHGLIGPREAPRIWERHVINCAVAAPFFGTGTTVADLGTGAGLPGLVLAIARPDLTLHLVEPLHRRIVWLERTLAELALTNVVIHEGRAEALHGDLRVDHTTARAVARLAALTRWSMPLLSPGGSLIALKGTTAQVELEQDWPAMRSSGAAQARVEVVQPPEVSTAPAIAAAPGGADTALLTVGTAVNPVDEASPESVGEPTYVVIVTEGSTATTPADPRRRGRRGQRGARSARRA
ncbi:MAG TPA: 16S rRNA (guanine(527)-N(7))-methyltransferase RsmG [Dermatophilaceae bacterium]|nr:16S rRNA (guanine(527)-N(7))-methyltransferase RsmG [Dermatophilaceae bacterium]